MKRVLITIGDPAGTGPLITVRALKELVSRNARFILIGTRKILEGLKDFPLIAGRIDFIDVKIKRLREIKRGYPNKASGEASLEYLETAVSLLKRRRFSLVTAPLSKEAVRLLKKDFVGHTEFLAEEFKVKNFSMLMVGRTLKVLLLTRHIPLREIPAYITSSYLKNNLELLKHSLKNLFKLKKIKIALCSLNPHAGVDTFLDKEERAILKAKEALEDKYTEFIGPYPSDTLFKKALKEKFSAIVALYHDQGMIPFKTLEFSRGVNLTLGLPFIRTSPAHGPAFDLVDKPHLIDYSPMREAIKLALKLSF